MTADMLRMQAKCLAVDMVICKREGKGVFSVVVEFNERRAGWIEVFRGSAADADVIASQLIDKLTVSLGDIFIEFKDKTK